MGLRPTDNNRVLQSAFNSGDAITINKSNSYKRGMYQFHTFRYLFDAKRPNPPLNQVPRPSS